MKKRKNSFLVWLLAAVLAIGMLPASALPSFADEPVNVATWMELKAALESDGDKTVKLTADVVHYDKITISGNKILELNGHKIRLKNKGRICVPAGAHLKVDGKVNGSEITSSDGLDLFCMEDGSLTIDEGRYTVFTVSSSVVYIGKGTAGGRIEINGGYFQGPFDVIHSESEQDLDPPEIVINGGTFVVVAVVWKSKDVTEGTVNGGTFYSSAGESVFDFGNTIADQIGRASCRERV